MDIVAFFSPPPRARRVGSLTRGGGGRSPLAPSDTLLGMEQRLERARRLQTHYRETVLIEPVGDKWEIRAMTEEEKQAHFNRGPGCG